MYTRLLNNVCNHFQQYCREEKLIALKMKFSIKDFFSRWDQIRSFLQFSADLVTFTEEILDGKLHFLWSDYFSHI